MLTDDFRSDRGRRLRLSPVGIKLGLIASLGLVIVACDASPRASQTTAATQAVSSEPSVEQMTSTRRFRTMFGLRADDAWIRTVFRDPTASDERFGVPLLPEEAAQVTNAQVRANSVSDFVAAYGATVPEDWAGMYVDQPSGGTVVAMFNANVAEHRRKLLAWLPAEAKVEVREATWSVAELRTFIARVEQERDWFLTIGTRLYAAEIAGLENLGGILVRFEGPHADADAAMAAIEAHFGNPPWLLAKWAGPGEWTGARGALEIITVDRGGRPVSVTVDSTAVDPYLVSSGEALLGTDKNGRVLQTNLPAIEYRIRAYRGVADERRVVAEGVVRVPANDRATVRLVID